MAIDFVKDDPNRKVKIRMLRGYFPADPNWPKHAISGDPVKVWPGTEIELPVEEAKRLLAAKFAERTDIPEL